MNRMHFVHSYLINPTNPISVNLIGAGGTGSQVLTALARINHALIELAHPGLHVIVWDDDTVSEANLGRQLFADAELRLPKAVALINRTNRFFGTNWKAKVRRYDRRVLHRDPDAWANLFVTCVDTVAVRQEVAQQLDQKDLKGESLCRPYYWLDFGNSQKTGQVVLATVGQHDQPKSEKFQPVNVLPFLTDEYAGELAEAVGDPAPSCSLAEALTRQDLFINSTLANMGSALLWKLFREGMTDTRGFFLNLSDFRSQPLKV